MKPVALPATGLCLAALACLPPLRGWLEADMARHMLLQFPALLLAGVALAGILPAAVRARIADCNAHGVAGLLLCLLVLSFWMIPRALDEALRAEPVALAKASSLIVAGTALRLSWRPAGPVVQLFFLGNWAWMGATVGLLYRQWPSRLCNAYLVDDQATAGMGLVVLAAAVPLAWLLMPQTRRWLAGGSGGPP